MAALPPDLTAEAVLDELERILAAPEFVKNAAARSFLDFVVRETLAGRGDRLKAFTIATMALQRRDDFDPQQNSIVRVHATRLRQLLEAYEATAPSTRRVRISLPRGTYQPSFESLLPSRREDRVEVADTAARQPSARQLMENIARRPALAFVAGAALAALLATVIVSALVPRTGDVAQVGMSGIPRIKITETGATRPSRSLPAILDGIEDGISGFEHVAVLPREASRQAAYTLLASTVRMADATALRIRLARGDSGEILWSREYPIHEEETASQVASIVRSVVVSVADGNGVVARDILDRAAAAGRHSQADCDVSTLRYLTVQEATLYPAVRACLDRRVHNQTEDHAALAFSAVVTIRGYLDALPGHRGTADLQLALQNAQRAYDRAPFRARTRHALFLARFYDKRYDDAFHAARQALVANPYSTLIAASIGAAYVARGQYDEGLTLLLPPDRGDTPTHGPFAAYVALAAYMRGNEEEHWRWASRTSTVTSAMGLLMRLIACHRRADEACVRQMETDLRQRFPGFADDIPAALERYAFIDPIRERLLTDLARAGVQTVAKAKSAANSDARPSKN